MEHINDLSCDSDRNQTKATEEEKGLFQLTPMVTRVALSMVM